MKKYFNIALFVRTAILLLAITFLIACDKDEPTCQGIDCLPPATQTGAGTFGCLVNGVPYVDNSGRFNCFYQFVNGEYYFGIGSSKEQAGLTQIIIGSNKSPILVNNFIEFNENIDTEFYAEINLKNISGDFVTTNQTDGFITFTKFTTNPNIVSATFEFKIKNPSTGVVYEITKGRLDAKFTQ